MVANTRIDAEHSALGTQHAREDVERELLGLVGLLADLVKRHGDTIDALGNRLIRLELLQATRGELDLLAKAGRE